MYQETGLHEPRQTARVTYRATVHYYRVSISKEHNYRAVLCFQQPESQEYIFHKIILAEQR